MTAPLKVLCVDDNADSLRGAAELLRAAGCEVHTCPDGRSALAEAAAFRPDVCVIDLSMPGMTGDELAVRLREGNDALRCVALTGSWDIDSRHKTHNVGFEEHLVKPVDPDRLVQTVLGREVAALT